MRLSRSRASALAVVIAAVTATGCGGGDPASEDELVEGDAYSYELPEDWRVASSDEGDALGASSIVEVDPSGDFASNLSVVIVEDVGGSIELDDYVAGGIEQVEDDPVAAGLPAGAEVDITSEPEAAELDGDDALLYAFETDFPKGEDTGLVQGTVGERQLTAIHDDDAFILTLTATPDELEDASEILDEVIDSWSWR